MNFTPPLSVFDTSPETTCRLSTPSIGVRQRSTSSDSLLLRQAKRRRSNKSPSTTFTVSPEQWKPENNPAHRYVVQTPSSTLHPFLENLEHTVAWGAQPPQLPWATHLPTPDTTSHSSFTRTTPERAATLPRSASLTAKALALSAGLHQREPRAGGDVEVEGLCSTLDTGLPSRTSTDPGPRLSPGPSSKDKFVAGLVGASVIAIESIWGPSAVVDETGGATQPSDSSVLPLQWFVREVLRRSRTSCSTLQVSLFYLHKCRREIRETVARAEAGTAAALEAHTRKTMSSYEMDAYPSPPQTPVDITNDRDRFADQLADVQTNPILCGRRMFLASLIAASKFLQDRNYSNKAWAKISGLPVQEINDNERVFLGLMKFQLHLGAEDFHKWTERLAALASQGAALEQSTSASSLRQRHGLARSATEYPSGPSLHDIGSSTPHRSATSSLGRTFSDPELATRHGNPQLPSSTVHLNLPARPRKHVATSTTALSTPLASPSPTEASSSDDESTDERSPRMAMPEQARRVVRLPAQGRYIPLAGLDRIPDLQHRAMDVCRGPTYGGFAANAPIRV